MKHADSNTAREPGASEETYFSVSPLMIFPDALGEFSVYLRSGDSRYVLYAGRNERFSLQHCQRLHDNGISKIYVRTERRSDYYKYVQDNMGRILADESIPLEIRSGILYEAASDVMKRAFDERLPDSIGKEQLEAAARLVHDSIQFLAKEDALRSIAPFIKHDYKTFTHCLHVFIYTVEVLKSYDFSEEDLFECGLGAMMHDLGKQRIAPEILNKPGSLDEEEMKEVRKHPVHGVALLKDLNIPQQTVNCILFHHERMDGRGYPLGMSGEDIPLPVRVVTVADVYDALTSDRPYSKACSPFEALNLMRTEMESAFDLDVFKRFVSVLSGAGL